MADDTAHVRLGVSSCLLGEQVRFDGGHKHDRFLTQTLGEHVRWVSVCPEVELGLGTPRESLRLVGDPDTPRFVGTRSSTDHTDAMRDFARRRADALADADLDGFVVKKDSPSCGMERVRVYGEEGAPPVRTGTGLFTRALMDRLPLLPIEEEGRLQDPTLRENFVARVFAHHRWRQFLADDPGPAELVAFHTAHKLDLQSHDEQAYRELGRLVADAGAHDRDGFARLLDTYGHRFMAAQLKPATRGSHSNVLSHLLGFLRDVLDADDRAELVDQIERYRTGLVPLVVPVTLLAHHFRRHPHDWVNQQTYLRPYPAELMLRNHV